MPLPVPPSGQRLIDGAATGRQMPPQISIADNEFALVDPSGEVTPLDHLPSGPALDMIVIDHNPITCKIYWGKDFNRSEIVPPLCWSDNGKAPSTGAQTPQSATCDTCPHNVIGSSISKISGARIKSCQDLKKFAVLVVDHPGVYLFQIKPGSFKAWNNYLSYLQMQKLPDGGKPDLCHVVTRVTFVGQGLMDFEAHQLIDDEMANRVVEVWEKNKQSDLTGLMVGKFDQPITALIGAPAQQMPAQPLPAPQPAPAPAPAPQPQPAPQQQAKQNGGDAFGQTQKRSPGRPKKTTPAPQQAPTTQQAQQNAPSAFGMQAPAQPSAEMNSRLDAAFNLPLKK